MGWSIATSSIDTCDRYHLRTFGWFEDPIGISACGETPSWETFSCKPQGEKRSSNSQ